MKSDKRKSCTICGSKISHEYYFNYVGPLCYDCCVDEEQKKDHVSYLYDEDE